MLKLLLLKEDPYNEFFKDNEVIEKYKTMSEKFVLLFPKNKEKEPQNADNMVDGTKDDHKFDQECVNILKDEKASKSSLHIVEEPYNADPVESKL